MRLLSELSRVLTPLKTWLTEHEAASFKVATSTYSPVLPERAKRSAEAAGDAMSDSFSGSRFLTLRGGDFTCVFLIRSVRFEVVQWFCLCFINPQRQQGDVRVRFPD